MRNHRNQLPTNQSPKDTETQQYSKAPKIDLPEPVAHPNRRATAAPPPPPPAPSNGSTRTQPAPNQLDDHPPPGHVVTAGQTLKHLPHNPARQAPAPNHHRKGGRVGILQTRSRVRMQLVSLAVTSGISNIFVRERNRPYIPGTIIDSAGIHQRGVRHLGPIIRSTRSIAKSGPEVVCYW